jgi:putative transposase
MVTDSANHAWSNYHRNAYGAADRIITPHAIYLQLGRTKAQRQSAYQTLFKQGLSEQMIKETQQTTQTATPLGSNTFKKES